MLEGDKIVCVEIKLTPGKILAIRKELKLTQLQLALLVGVTPITVSRWERGDIVPRLPTMRFLVSLSEKKTVIRP